MVSYHTAELDAADENQSYVERYNGKTRVLTPFDHPDKPIEKKEEQSQVQEKPVQFESIIPSEVKQQFEAANCELENTLKRVNNTELKQKILQSVQPSAQLADGFTQAMQQANANRDHYWQAITPIEKNDSGNPG